MAIYHLLLGLKSSCACLAHSEECVGRLLAEERERAGGGEKREREGGREKEREGERERERREERESEKQRGGEKKMNQSCRHAPFSMWHNKWKSGDGHASIAAPRYQLPVTVFTERKEKSLRKDCH